MSQTPEEREKHRIWQKEYRRLNRATLQAKRLKYYRENKDKILAQRRLPHPCAKCGVIHERCHSYCLTCWAAYQRDTRPKVTELGAWARWKIKIMKRMQKAVKSGRILKTPCVDCGEEKVQMYHEDYDDNPMKIVWLCRPHLLERVRLRNR